MSRENFEREFFFKEDPHLVGRLFVSGSNLKVVLILEVLWRNMLMP